MPSSCRYWNSIPGRQLTLELDLILNNEGLALVVNLLGELGRDGVVSGSVLDDKPLIALDTLVLEGLLDRPFTNIGPFLLLLVLVGGGGILLGVGRLPPCLPVIGELLKEVCLDGGRLVVMSVSTQLAVWPYDGHPSSSGCGCFWKQSILSPHSTGRGRGKSSLQ